MNYPKVTLKDYNYDEAVNNEIRRLNSGIITVDNAAVFEQIVHPLTGIRQIFRWTTCQTTPFYQSCCFKDYYTHMWLAIKHCKDAIILCKSTEGKVFGLEYHKGHNSYVFSVDLDVKVRLATTVVYHFSELSATNRLFKLVIAKDYQNIWECWLQYKQTKAEYDGAKICEMFTNNPPSDYWGKEKYTFNIMECEVYVYNE